MFDATRPLAACTAATKPASLQMSCGVVSASWAPSFQRGPQRTWLHHMSNAGFQSSRNQVLQSASNEGRPNIGMHLRMPRRRLIAGAALHPRRVLCETEHLDEQGMRTERWASVAQPPLSSHRGWHRRAGVIDLANNSCAAASQLPAGRGASSLSLWLASPPPAAHGRSLPRTATGGALTLAREGVGPSKQSNSERCSSERASPTDLDVLERANMRERRGHGLLE